MSQEDRLEIQLELTKLIGDWFCDSDVCRPLVGDDAHSLMAQAATTVLFAYQDLSDYYAENKPNPAGKGGQ